MSAPGYNLSMSALVYNLSIPAPRLPVNAPGGVPCTKTAESVLGEHKKRLLCPLPGPDPGSPPFRLAVPLCPGLPPHCPGRTKRWRRWGHGWRRSVFSLLTCAANHALRRSSGAGARTFFGPAPSVHRPAPSGASPAPFVHRPAPSVTHLHHPRPYLRHGGHKKDLPCTK